jgi:hypothetical protein
VPSLALAVLTVPGVVQFLIPTVGGLGRAVILVRRLVVVRR